MCRYWLKMYDNGTQGTSHPIHMAVYSALVNVLHSQWNFPMPQHYSHFHNSRESEKKKRLFVSIWHWIIQVELLLHEWDLFHQPHAKIATPSCTPEPLEPHFTTPILACLTVHVPVQNTAKKKSTRKETKAKEFTHCFSATKSSYVQLLNTILTKHHIGKKFYAMEHHYYGCKIQVPPAK